MIFVIGGLCVLSGQGSEDSYYYEKIATPNNAINFTFGFYAEKYSWHESSESKYTSIPAVIINEPNAKQLDWKDYKVFIMLKDGTLFNSYKTVAKTGNYACHYTVKPGEKHYQHFTFSAKFKPQQILHVWLKLTDGNFIKLLFKI